MRWPTWLRDDESCRSSSRTTFTPDAVAAEALRVLTDPAHAAHVRSELREVRGKLGTPGASRRAAEAVLEVALGRHDNLKVD